MDTEKLLAFIDLRKRQIRLDETEPTLTKHRLISELDRFKKYILKEELRSIAN